MAAQTHAEHLAALARVFDSLPDARTAFEQDAAAFAESFATTTEYLQRLRRQLDEATTLRAQDLARAPDREEALATATQTHTAASAADTALREEQTRLRQNRQTLFAGRPADTVQTELESAATAARTTHETRARELAEAEKSAAAAQESVTAQRAACELAVTALTAAQAALTQALTAFATPVGTSFDRAALAPYLARDAAWLADERRALTTLRDSLNTATGQHQARTDALARHRANTPTTEPEDTVRGHHAARAAELAAAKERHLAAAAALASDDQRRRDAADLLARIETRRAAAAPWGKLDELIGSADGAKFRAIVQRHALDILLGHANAQLDLVSARYRLERLPESLNLIVRDRDMADERRSVHSLSGGESFLVSLSLALGLASLTSNRLRIESLFIDEGFGSLDPATLEIAMNALMRLESQGRKVGVISHVTEMADAIPVQIRVVKGRGGASRLEVPGAAPATPDPAEPANPATSVAASSATDIDALATTLLGLLESARASGDGPVSTVSLRKTLGCDQRAFNAARDRLGPRVTATGRSLALTSNPEPLNDQGGS